MNKIYKQAVDIAETFSCGGAFFAGDVKRIMMDPLNEMLKVCENYEELETYIVRQHASRSSAVEELKGMETKADKVQLIQLEATVSMLEDILEAIGVIRGTVK